MEYGSDEQFALKCQVTGAEEKTLQSLQGVTIWPDLPYDDPQAGVSLHSYHSKDEQFAMLNCIGLHCCQGNS